MLVLYSVEITRFSSLLWRCLRIVSFCTLLKLQGSQAGVISCKEGQEFCTLLKLQGSQASNYFEALTEPCHVGAW